MINNNMKNVFIACIPNGQVPLTVYKNGTKIRDTSTNNGTSVASQFGSFNINTKGVFEFGSSRENESADQYELVSPFTVSDFTFASGSGSKTASGSQDDYKYIYTQSFTYTGTETITINEVAFVLDIISCGWSSTYAPKIYFAREVLSNPITVSTNDTFTVSMLIG